MEEVQLMKRSNRLLKFTSIVILNTILFSFYSCKKNEKIEITLEKCIIESTKENCHDCGVASIASVKIINSTNDSIIFPKDYNKIGYKINIVNKDTVEQYGLSIGKSTWVRPYDSTTIRFKIDILNLIIYKEKEESIRIVKDKFIFSHSLFLPFKYKKNHELRDTVLISNKSINFGIFRIEH